jgi:hypothetical protein
MSYTPPSTPLSTIGAIGHTPGCDDGLYHPVETEFNCEMVRTWVELVVF